jgi:hypothetical protein
MCQGLQNRMRARVFSAILLGIFALLAAPAMAQPYGPPPGYRGGVQPLDRLLPGIRRDHPGNFYDAEGPTYGPEGDPHYHLKWMTPDGRVIWYDTDARSGRVLRSSPGRDSFDGPAPPPGFARPYAGPGPGYSSGPRFVPRYAPRGFGGGGMRGGGRWRH